MNNEEYIKWQDEVDMNFIQRVQAYVTQSCDFVLDKGQTEHAAFSDNADEEIEAETIQEAPQILLSTVSYLSKIQNSLPRDSTIQQHAKQMFKDFIISYYVDTETGLPSVNHFVLK